VKFDFFYETVNNIAPRPVRYHNINDSVLTDKECIELMRVLESRELKLRKKYIDGLVKMIKRNYR
jgi:hypothetical protein